MLTIDAIILAVFLISVVIGLVRGFFREALSVATWAAAVWIALNYSQLMDPLLGSLASPDLRFWAGKILIFILVLIIGGLINHLIHILVAKTGLSGTDRLLGMIFGAIRGVLVVGLAVVIFRLMGLDQEAWWEESRAIPFLEPAANWMQGYLEEGLAQLQNVVGPVGVSPEIVKQQ
jgi:membrane protein required for colicin V production